MLPTLTQAFGLCALSSSGSRVSSSLWGVWCGVSQAQSGPSAWQDASCLSGSFLWWDPGGNVCFPFLCLEGKPRQWQLYKRFSCPPPERFLLFGTSSPLGGLSTPEKVGQRFLCPSASHTPALRC